MESDDVQERIHALETAQATQAASAARASRSLVINASNSWVFSPVGGDRGVTGLA